MNRRVESQSLCDYVATVCWLFVSNNSAGAHGIDGCQNGSYTRLTHEEATRKTLGEYREIINGLITRHGQHRGFSLRAEYVTVR